MASDHWATQFLCRKVCFAHLAERSRSETRTVPIPLNCAETRRKPFPQMQPLSGPVRDTLQYRARPFRDSIAEGMSHAFCLVFMCRRASTAEIPLLWGVISHLHFACSLRGKGSEGGGGYHTQLVMLRHRNPIARNRGASLTWPRGIAQCLG